MKRIIPLLLLSVLLFSGLISCVTEKEQSTQSIQKPENTSSEETVAETEEVFTLGLPKDMDLQGQTYIIWIYDDHLRGDIEGDEVAYSQYAARSSAEELLNYKSEFVIHNGGMVNDVRKVIQAQDDTYALCGESANGFAPLFAEKTFYNISDLPYINLNNPWWMSEYVRSVSIDENNPSLLTGDMSYYSIGMLCCSYVNDRLLNEYIGLSKDDMYQLVLDGKWTLDRFLTYSENAYHDINGNGEKDIDDIYALTAQGHYTFQKLLYGAGLMCTSRDEDGFPMLSLNNEYTINLIDKVLPLFNSDECYKTDENITAAQFAKGKNLFLVNRFVSAQWNLREMEDSYSIIPLPKYDENEKTYHSFIEQNIQWYGVPITARDNDSISAIMEAWNYYGYQIVRPTFIELSMKTKYSRDNTASQMIDIIIENSSTDFLFIWSFTDKVGNLPDIFREIFIQGENNFSSLYKKQEKTTLKKLEVLKQEAME